MCPDYPRRIAVVDPAVIWTYQTRTLTSFTGQPRIDLLGEDATFEAGTGVRKALIDRLANIEAFDTPIEGTLIADGSEQIMVLDEISGNPLRYLEGYISLKNLLGANTIILRIYVNINGVDYEKYFERKYVGGMSTPLLYVYTKPARYGIKITLQQTVGLSTFDYQFFRRRVL